MVFQRFNLFPHMTALQNVMEAPIRVKGESRAEAHRGPSGCSTGSGSASVATPTRRSCPAASSSASPSPVPWPWSRS